MDEQFPSGEILEDEHPEGEENQEAVKGEGPGKREEETPEESTSDRGPGGGLTSEEIQEREAKDRERADEIAEELREGASQEGPPQESRKLSGEEQHLLTTYFAHTQFQLENSIHRLRQAPRRNIILRAVQRLAKGDSISPEESQLKTDTEQLGNINKIRRDLNEGDTDSARAYLIGRVKDSLYLAKNAPIAKEDPEVKSKLLATTELPLEMLRYINPEETEKLRQDVEEVRGSN
jgi:hypothetical protein